jgi:general stress protein CsbA
MNPIKKGLWACLALTLALLASGIYLESSFLVSMNLFNLVMVGTGFLMVSHI